VTAAALVVLGAAAQVNAYFAQFPTPRALFGLPPAGQVDFTELRLSPHPAHTSATVTAAGTGQALPLAARWRPPADLPAAGVVSTVVIPGPVSGFAARPAWVYLPPAALVRNPPALPVLILLPGQPGSPRDWIDAGHLPAMMDRYATAHRGLAPVVVMPDPLGSVLANPLCVDSRLGNAQSYLARDVPAWVRAHLPVNTDPRSWAIAGLSEGGTCSWQLAVNAPRTYPTFLDISGQAEPTLGSRARTIAGAYGGDPAAFDRVNPAAVLTHRRFPATTGIIVVGSADRLYRPQARIVADLCRRAGIDVHYQEVPGGHDWRVWSNGLATTLPLLAQRLQLI
jgi:enterochelin esterase-like enzyme